MGVWGVVWVCASEDTCVRGQACGAAKSSMIEYYYKPCCLIEVTLLLSES